LAFTVQNPFSLAPTREQEGFNGMKRDLAVEKFDQAARIAEQLDPRS
jgi:hypothetical protein